MAEIRDLELLNNIDIIYKNKIILYGAGDFGKRALKLLSDLEISALGICDSNEEKTGTDIEGYKVLSIEEFSNFLKDKNIIVIITMVSPDSIQQVLKTLDILGGTKIPCYTYFALKYTVEFHINDDRIKDSYREDYSIGRRIYNENVYGDRMNSIRRFIWCARLYDVIFVLTPRKVGTTSVARSLEKASIHSIQTDRLMPGNWTNDKTLKKDEIIEILRRNKKIKIISLIRDPIARAISDYFYGLDIGGFSRNYLVIRPNIYRGVIDYMEEEIKVDKYGFVFEWFNREIGGMFGIDVYKHDFDKEKGFQIIHTDNVDFLLIKMEKLNECQEIIGEFSGAKKFKLMKENVGNENLYKFAYTEFLKTVKIPKHILEFYYKGNKAMDHFYTTEEKEKFIERWTKK